MDELSGADQGGVPEWRYQRQEVHQAHCIQCHSAYRRFHGGDGSTRKNGVVAETKKMLDKNIKVTCTAVRVPVFIGHSEAVTG
ncbi:MAG: Asd/ArgC dimerization domain-containing protein [Nitratireductor sp.]